MLVRAAAAALSLGLVGLLAFAGAANALTFAPTVMFEVVGGTGAVQVNSLGSASTTGNVTTWTLTAPTTIDGGRIDTWSAKLKEDPYVTNNFNVTNTTMATQTYIASVTLPIPAFNYSQIVFSSVGITLTDSDGDNVLAFDQSGVTSIYRGQVNGATVLSLDPAGLPLTTASCTPFPSVPGCSATGSAGVPLAGINVAPAIASSLGIILQFELSPGDSAALTSRFEVVPEPTTGLLVGLGMAALAWRRRGPHTRVDPA